MKPIISPEEAARLDAMAVDPVTMLMERAGAGVAYAAARMGAGYGTRVAILAGKGNNGGDGYVAARYLARRGCSVTVYAAGSPTAFPADVAAAAAAVAGIPVVPLGDLEPADLVIDALFGAGFRGELPADLVRWVEHGAPVLAVDVPSGLDASTGEVSGAAFTADVTVTFHARKTGHILGEGPDRSGEIAVVDIGLGEARADMLLCEDVDAPAPTRSRTAHKWSAGAVLVAGGSPGFTGAPMLAAQAALHGGAGAATVACPGALQPVYAAMSAGVMTLAVGAGDHFVPDDAARLLAAAGRYDVLVLGPGIGTDAAGFVAAVVENWPGKLLIDADALNVLTPAPLGERHDPTIITPHSGEFLRLTGERGTPGTAASLAHAAGITVLLKGNPTFVASGETWVVASGGPELATIGTGDVLAGLTAALWARGLDAPVAARSAAYRHGLAAANLAAFGTVTAEALASEIGGWAW
jgi:NAD(P)H-hydrate epimerase